MITVYRAVFLGHDSRPVSEVVSSVPVKTMAEAFDDLRSRYPQYAGAHLCVTSQSNTPN